MARIVKRAICAACCLLLQGTLVALQASTTLLPFLQGIMDLLAALYNACCTLRERFLVHANLLSVSWDLAALDPARLLKLLKALRLGRNAIAKHLIQVSPKHAALRVLGVMYACIAPVLLMPALVPACTWQQFIACTLLRRPGMCRAGIPQGAVFGAGRWHGHSQPAHAAARGEK